jgi:hypothetical protein
MNERKLPKGIYERRGVLWIHYSLRGKVFRESAHTDDPQKAVRLRKFRLNQVGADRIGAKPFIPPASQKITVNELLDSLERDLKLEHKLSPQIATNIRHLREKFGFCMALSLTADDIEKYITTLLAEGYRPASVNRHTQLLQQSFNLPSSSDG